MSHRKFVKEVQKLTLQRDALAQRGIWMLGNPQYPVIELLYVPNKPVLLAMGPANSFAQLHEAGQLAEIEVLAGRAFKASFDLTDYDLRAPSIEFRDPWTDQLLNANQLIRAQEIDTVRGPHVVLLDQHPTTGKSFLCLRGVREYHEHPQHSGDDWLLYRPNMSVFSAAMSLWRAIIDVVHPVIARSGDQVLVHWLTQGKH